MTEEKKVRVSLNMVDCTGCGGCVEACPEGFAWDETGDKAVLVNECVPVDKIREAISYCPCDCIEIEGECEQP